MYAIRPGVRKLRFDAIYGIVLDRIARAKGLYRPKLLNEILSVEHVRRIHRLKHAA